MEPEYRMVQCSKLLRVYRTAGAVLPRRFCEYVFANLYAVKIILSSRCLSKKAPFCVAATRFRGRILDPDPLFLRYDDHIPRFTGQLPAGVTTRFTRLR